MIIFLSAAAVNVFRKKVLRAYIYINTTMLMAITLRSLAFRVFFLLCLSPFSLAAHIIDAAIL